MPNHKMDTLEIRRKRLLWRSGHRGMKELDLILEAFATKHLADLGVDEISEYERLLALPDGELYAWLSGQVPIPLQMQSTVMRMLCALDYMYYRS